VLKLIVHFKKFEIWLRGELQIQIQSLYCGNEVHRFAIAINVKTLWGRIVLDANSSWWGESSMGRIVQRLGDTSRYRLDKGLLVHFI